MRLVLTATTRGTASPSACGQAMTITVTMRSTANGASAPRANQTNSVVAPTESVIQVSHCAARFATSWVRERLSGAGAHERDDLGEIGLVARLAHLQERARPRR